MPAFASHNVVGVVVVLDVVVVVFRSTLSVCLSTSFGWLFIYIVLLLFHFLYSFVPHLFLKFFLT